MIIAGCDIGSLTAKAVIMKDGEILAEAVRRALPRPAESAESVMGMALHAVGLTLENIDYVVGTGYGRQQIPFVDSVESEISCHAKGAWYLNPAVRMVIDIGGQDAKAIRIAADGRVNSYRYNDKCATGTGRFLEVMAEALEVPLEELGSLAADSREKLIISSQCVIFAETEVVSLVNEGKATCDIINALHQSLAKRAASLARGIEVEEEVVMTGGVAKNSGVFNAISESLDVSLKALGDTDPQIVGALGAALYAAEAVEELKKAS